MRLRPVLEIFEVGSRNAVDLAGDAALEAAHDLALGFAIAGAPLDLVARALAVAQAADDDQVQRSVCLPDHRRG